MRYFAFFPLCLTIAGLAACDQAIDERYGGLVVIPIEEVTFTSIDEVAGVDPVNSVDLPWPRPSQFSAPDLTPQEAAARASQAAENAALAGQSAASAENSLEAAEIALAEANAALAAAEAAARLGGGDSLTFDPSILNVGTQDLNSSSSGTDVNGDRPLERPTPFPQSFDQLAAFQADQANLAALEADRIRRAEEERARQIAAGEAERLREAERQAAQAAEQAAQAAQAAEQERARLAQAEKAAEDAAAEAQRLASIGTSVDQTAPLPSQIDEHSDKLIASSLFLPLDYSQGKAISTPGELQALYAQTNFDLAQVIAGDPVPSLILERLPQQFEALNQTNHPLLKELFIKSVLPICLVSNARIKQERAYILASQDTGEQLDRALDSALRGLGAKYGVATRSALLTRVNTIPVSLCVAQAVLESRWGMGADVVDQNALFGPWVRGAQGADLIRGHSDQGGKSVPFTSLQAAAHTYMLYLNTSETLSAFRSARAQAQSSNRSFSGLSAAGLMGPYSPDKPNYADLLGRLIRENQLDQYDLARLADGRRQAIPVL